MGGGGVQNDLLFVNNIEDANIVYLIKHCKLGKLQHGFNTMSCENSNVSEKYSDHASLKHIHFILKCARNYWGFFLLCAWCRFYSINNIK